MIFSELNNRCQLDLIYDQSQVDGEYILFVLNKSVPQNSAYV